MHISNMQPVATKHWTFFKSFLTNLVMNQLRDM